MAGGPSQLELFDYKPELQKYDGKADPESLLKGKRFAFMDTFAKETPKLLGTRREFKQHGKSGSLGLRAAAAHRRRRRRHRADLGRLDRELQSRAGQVFVNTGSTRFGRPSMGAWVTYGIGSESQDLPGLRRAAIRPARPARRRGSVGQRLPAHGLPGRALPLRRRADPESLQSAGRHAAQRSSRRSRPFAT